MKARAFFRDVRDHAASNLAGLYWEQQPEPITRWQVVREHVRVAALLVRYALGALVCARWGHSTHVDVVEHVHCERDARGRITDIDGGSIDWFCPRCGQGGHSWF